MACTSTDRTYLPRTIRTVALLLGILSTFSSQAFAQPASERDACTFNSIYCIKPAPDAGAAFGQLFSTVNNPLAPHPPEFSDVYGALFTQFINSQISGLSVGSSLAGFAFVRDATTGALTAKSTSFGPLLGDRPQTAGKGAFSFALTTQRTRFGTLDGVDLAVDGVIDDYDYTTGQQRPGIARSQRYTSRFAVKTSSFIVGAAYGITDRLDLNVTIPFVRTTVEGTTAYDFAAPGGSQPTLLTAVKGTSSGLGDISVRGKFNVRRSTRDEWAIVAEQRLPTGDEDALLGVGSPATKIAVIGGLAEQRITPHWTLGYTWAGKGVTLPELRLFGADLETFRLFGTSVIEPSNELNYGAGIETAATPRLTVAGEIVGRILRNSVTLITATDLSRANYTRSLTFFEEAGSVNLMIGAVGAKWNVSGQWLVIGNILFPLTNAGLRPGITPVISIQKAFSGR